MSRWVAVVLATAVALGSHVAAVRAEAASADLVVPPGFTVERIATLNGPRELAVTPNGDLIVGTNGTAVDIVPDAQGTPGAPRVFAQLDQKPVAGVALADGTVYLGAQFGVFAVPYATGDRSARAAPHQIATVRPSRIARDHVTTSVAVAGRTLYASVGSSCNNCQPDLDATRATIQAMHLDGSAMAPRAQHIRNPIALAVDPQTDALWAGVAGQDELAHGHPYEIVDDVSAHPGIADYGWPYCYEDRIAVNAAHDCAHAAVPRVVLPAYETPIGATFYPLDPHGRYAFPATYRGGLFVSLHGSWHQPPVPPRVVFVPMSGDLPQTPVDWANPDAQWHDFLSGFQLPDDTRIGRPTGIAVGTDGSLFVADDGSGSIYRIRPSRVTARR